MLRAAARAGMEPLEGRMLMAAGPSGVVFDDTEAPKAVALTAADVTDAGGASHTVTITYSDDIGIDTSSINTGDIVVTAPGGGTLNVTNAEVIEDSGFEVVARYTFDARGGSWDAGDSGEYTVALKENEVRDLGGNGAPAASGGFEVAIARPDTEKPTSQISAPDVNDPAGVYDVVITYSDNDRVNDTTIGADDITVTGPGGAVLVVTGVDKQVSDGGATVTATYHVRPPGDTWDAADNGEYTVTLAAGAVTDASGNTVGARSSTFDVEVLGPDTTVPIATIRANDVGTARSTYTVVVEYNDDRGVAALTIGTDDITVSGQGGSLVVTGVERDSSDGGRRVTATYTLTPPGGAWNDADNGQYTVTLAAGAVTDRAGNPVAATTKTFNVDVAPPDTTDPDAALTAVNLTTAGGSHTVRVVYTDDRRLDAGSVGEDDITVLGPGGPVDVDDVDIDSEDGSRRLVVTYRLDGPGDGSWGNLDNGLYAVTLNAGAVNDEAGNVTPGRVGSFNVNIPLPDNQGPTAEISVGDVTSEGETHTITVVYTDDRAVRASNAGDSDIIVTGPKGRLDVTSFQAEPETNAARISVTYVIAAPEGSWDSTDNGDYLVEIVPSQVRDTAGNDTAAASKVFRVNVAPPDGAGPSATIVTTPVTTPGGTDHTVTVTYSDDAGVDIGSIGNDDIAVTGPAGNLPVTNVVLSQSNGGKTVTATYTIGAPQGGWAYTHNGGYTVAVRGGRVRDAAGNGSATPTGAFTVAVPAPAPIDETFNGGAGVRTEFVTESIATQGDGMILVAGRQGDVNAGTSRGVLQRLNAAGAVDTTFGSGGRVITAEGAGEAYFALVMQGADKFLVAGTANGEFLLARYDLTGKLDPTFGQGGRVVTDLGANNDAAYGLALAPDGKIVVVGGSGGNFAFARYDPNGAPDIGFAQAGKQLFDLGSNTDVPGAVVVQSDGKVIAAGSSGNKVALVRLRADGEADTSFSGDALLFVEGLSSRENAAQMDHSQALALQSDGKILVANHTADGNFATARIDGDGNLDSGYGTNGVAVVDFGGDDDADALLIQDTGEILVIGTSLAGGTGKTTVAAFNSSGKLIEGFGTGGRLTLDTGLVPAGRELHVGDLVVRAFGTRQNDGRAVVGSSNGNPSSTGSSLTRLIVPGSMSQPQGTLLGSFGIINGKNQRLTTTDADGTTLVFSIRNGTGTAFLNGDKINLVITDGGKGATVTVKAKGGNGRVNFGDVTINGSLKSMAVKNGDLAGTLSASALIGKLALGEVNGTIAAGGSIASVTAANLTNARILAGTGLGVDRKLGGTGGNGDSYAGGSIGALKVSGKITGSLISAGLNPIDGTYGNDDDIVVGGAAASFIKSISAKGGADETTKFVAAAFKTAKLGAKVAIATDPRFRTIA